MLSTIAGVPAHPLFVHAAVVFAPLAALISIAWAIRPQAKTLGYAAAAVNLLSLGFTWLARSSGETLLKMQGFTEEDPGPLAKHAEYANYLTGSVIALGAVVLGFFVISRFVAMPGWLLTLVRVLTIVAAIAVIVTVIMTGHEGAMQVWNNDETARAR